MFEFLSSWHPGYLWILLGALLLILEMLIPGFIIGSFAIGSLAAALVAWIGGPFGLQIIVFAVVGVAVLIPARRFLLKHAPAMETALDRMLGKRGLCLDPIEGDLKPGAIRVDGARWTATASAGVRIPAGATVQIVKVEAAKVVVAPVDG